MYDKLLERFTKRAIAIFNEIEATHNFENGSEFEVAICKLLRLFLPKKYSICRGYIVSSEGDKVGDDIIIYDAENFPKVRTTDDDFAVKQYIPSEAVYAYIEAKNTLCVDGSGSDNTLLTAFNQIKEVDKLMNKRDKISSNLGLAFDRYNPILFKDTKYWPDTRNPIYTVIFSRYIKSRKTKKDALFKDENGVEDALNYFKKCLDDTVKKTATIPDLIIAGKNYISIPVFVEGPDKITFGGPFYMSTKNVASLRMNDLSIGIGIANLLRALDFIKLTPIKYDELILQALRNKPCP